MLDQQHREVPLLGQPAEELVNVANLVSAETRCGLVKQQGVRPRRDRSCDPYYATSPEWELIG